LLLESRFNQYQSTNVVPALAGLLKESLRRRLETPLFKNPAFEKYKRDIQALDAAKNQPMTLNFADYKNAVMTLGGDIKQLNAFFTALTNYQELQNVKVQEGRANSQEYVAGEDGESEQWWQISE